MTNALFSVFKTPMKHGGMSGEERQIAVENLNSSNVSLVQILLLQK